MKTDTIISSSSALSLGIMPSATASATALATAIWAGPKIWAAWSIFFTVTFGTIRVDGLGGRLGRITPKRGVCPAESCDRPEAKAVATGPSLSPIIRSI
ncbi:MAG: hypothetical protein A4E49_03390 [Methanosaeta sp. PtaU1.Bin112]|nr:MAG: hypothetical protein A4E49_03390 [Methanosaeta sp. PtaU1.Bin112]